MPLAHVVETRHSLSPDTTLMAGMSRHQFLAPGLYTCFHVDNCDAYIFLVQATFVRYATLSPAIPKWIICPNTVSLSHYTNFPIIFAAVVLPRQLANLLQVHHLTMTWTHMALILALTNITLLTYLLDWSGTSLSIHPDVS